MKQSKILFLVVMALLPLILISCSGTAQPKGGWSGTTVHDGIIYVGTRDGGVVAINSSTGSQKWSYPINPPTAIYTTPIVDGELVYVGTYSGRVYALTVARGIERWVYPRTGSIGAVVASPVIANETIYISSSDGLAYALDTTYGDLKWKSERLAEKLWTSPVIHGDTLYISTFDGHIYALSAETGDLLDWSFKSRAGFTSSPVIYGDTIYVGSFDRYLYAIRIGSDLPLWRFPQEKPAGNWFWAPPVVNEGIVYAGCLDGKLYAVDAATGEKAWEYNTEGPIVSSPVLTDNLLIVTNGKGTVYFFDLSENLENTAVPLKVVSLNTTVRSSFCAREGMAYIRDENNQLYAVDIQKGELSWKISLAEKK